jgi:excisionase family DNA binding protein
VTSTLRGRPTASQTRRELTPRDPRALACLVLDLLYDLSINANESQLLHVKQAAREIDVSADTIRRAIRTGRLRALRCGPTGRYRIRGRTRYQRGSMKFYPSRPTVPLVVDHDPHRQIGTVEEIVELDDINGPWLAARCVLDDPVPTWLRKGAGASWSYRPLRKRQLGDGEHVLYALLEEVTVTQRQEPREPAAQVVLLYDPKPLFAARGTLVRNCGVITGIR